MLVSAWSCSRSSHTAPTPPSGSTSVLANNGAGRTAGGVGAGGDAGEVGGVEIEHNESGVRVSLEVSFARSYSGLFEEGDAGMRLTWGCIR